MSLSKETNSPQASHPDQYFRDLLHRYWGYEDFRSIQLDIIRSISSGQDTLGLMPTGGGKSITFQVPALAMEGVCLVISPLVALMKDQVMSLRKKGIRAECIHSGMTHSQILTALENTIFGGYKLLYVSPERLSSPLFLAKLHYMRVSFITIDEAHCICQWGYDFRPSYLEIVKIRKYKPDCPVLALTATATPEVAEDIQRQLHFEKGQVFRASFSRPNLAYTIYHADSCPVGLMHVLERIPGCGIIYMRNRRRTQELADQLNEQGISATYYHAGLASSQRDENQKSWLRGEKRIMVATNAFGMGIDKPDVRLVVHTDLPDSIEEYFQEAGRAGRDGQKAYSVIVMDGKELERSRRRLARKYPSQDYVRDVYEKLCFFFQIAVGEGRDATRELNMMKFCRVFRFHPVMLTSALELLDNAGFIRYRDEEEGTSRVRINTTRPRLWSVLSPLGEKIFLSLLRHYGGIFLDYVFIEEELVAEESGATMDQIYLLLTDLTRSGLVNYVPRKKVPKVTFVQRRVLTEEVYLPKAVYQDRREAFAMRLKAIQEYCMNTSECRASLLLKYFGESPQHSCGICDVCEAEKNPQMSQEEFKAIRAVIIQLLRGGPQPASALRINGVSERKLEWVLDYMRAKEEIRLRGLEVELASPFIL